jgi:nickel-dependent lactate racemase
MVTISLKPSNGSSISDEALLDALKKSIEGRSLSKILLLPPDMTRLHSYAGKITAMYYKMLKDTCKVDIMPALGTHEAMSKEECLEFFGPDVPYESVITHNW